MRIIREVLPAYREAGIRLAIENHDRFRAHELVAIIAATDADYVGICLDTANSLGADEGIWEVARTLAPHTLNLHVKDYRIERLDHQMGFTVRGAPAGVRTNPRGLAAGDAGGYREVPIGHAGGVVRSVGDDRRNDCSRAKVGRTREHLPAQRNT